MWQIKHCCFCVDLRTATLLLAVCGALSNLFNAVNLIAMPYAHHFQDSSSLHQQPVNQSFFNFSALYSLFAAASCILGIVGVLKRDPNRLRIFALLNWFGLGFAYAFIILLSVVLFTVDVDTICESVMEDPNLDMDMDKCKQVYTTVALSAVVGVAISLLIKTHYCLAIWSYYIRLVNEERYSESPYGYTVITNVPPPIYTLDTEKDFKPDVKVNQDVKQ